MVPSHIVLLRRRLLRACLSRVFLYCVNRIARTLPSQERDLLFFKGIGGFEKLFEFFDRSRRQMSDVLQVSFKGGPIRKRKDPVITFTFPLAGLQDAKHAYRFASKHKAWMPVCADCACPGKAPIAKMRGVS
jgi:hypothetical protein